jgi:uncharacterized RDD family membrane protein YckC
MESTQQDYLSHETNLEMASSGKRFGNYIIDLICFYVVFFVGFILIAIVSPGVAESVDDDSAGTDLLLRLIGTVFYGVFMGVLEGIFKGKTLGKVITGTRAVNEDGTPLSFGTAFQRGLIRIIPFNPLG